MLALPHLRWDLTMQCNLACRHCQVGDLINHSGIHPSKEQLEIILSRLDENTVAHVNLIGGEPCTYPWIDHVMETLVHKLVPFTLSTNGLIIPSRMIEILRQSYASSIVISVDGPDRASHDYIRGKHAFDKTIQNIATLVQYLGDRAGIGISCTLNALTIDRMGEMHCFARALGVSHLQFDYVRDMGNASRNIRDLAVDRQRLHTSTVRYYRQHYADMNSSGFKVRVSYLTNTLRDDIATETGIILPFSPSICTGASTSAALGADGRLWPCLPFAYSDDPGIRRQFDFSGNSLVEHAFSDVWHCAGFVTLRQLLIAKSYLADASPCQRCTYKKLCAPCPMKELSNSCGEYCLSSSSE